MEEPGRLQSMGCWRVTQDWATSLSLACIGEGNGNPLQYSCLENPRDGGACGLPSMGSHRVRHNWSDAAAAAAAAAKDLRLTESFTVLYLIHIASALRIHDSPKKLEGILARYSLQDRAEILLQLSCACLWGTWHKEFEHSFYRN